MTWCVAMVRSPDELSLAKRLRQDGQTVYTPTTERQIRKNGGRATRTVAAWSGYLLIRNPLPIEDSRFYGFIRHPDFERKTLTDKEVEKYRLDERLGAFQRPLKGGEVLSLLGIGEEVNVPVWPWNGRRGYVKSIVRGMVELAGLEFEKPVRIPLALIRPDIPVQ